MVMIRLSSKMSGSQRVITLWLRGLKRIIPASATSTSWRGVSSAPLSLLCSLRLPTIMRTYLLNILRLTCFIFLLTGTAKAGLFSPPDPKRVRLEIPDATREIVVTKPIIIGKGEHRDFGWARLVPKNLGDGSQREGQKPVMALLRGASVSRVIIGKPGADGIYCVGDNKLIDVYFEDVGEDAITVKGGPVLWDGGGARKASDKIVQMNHKGPFIGKNLIFEDFSIGVRGNGNKKFRNMPFRVELENVQASEGQSLVKLSSKGSRVTMKNVNTWDVKNVTSISNGAKRTVKGLIKR